MTTEIERTAYEWFNHYAAEEIRNRPEQDVVSGWVPAHNVDPLTDELDDAHVQYWDDEGHYAFVTTL